jgi:hypothetical protein
MYLLKKYFTIIIVIIVSTNVFSQTSTSENQNNDLNNLFRLGDYIFQNHFSSTKKLNRFISVNSLNGYERWTSPSTKLLIDGIPFYSFPLNLSSIDMLPIEIIGAKDIVFTTSPTISEFSESTSGTVEIFRRPISDNFEITFRGFFGSETGDPLFHVFTRPQISTTNINKIIPSGTFSISNKIDLFKYRFTAGYFGYYATNSVNFSAINDIDNYYMQKQNKQVLISLETEYKLVDSTKIFFNTSLLSYYGWELTPFITSLAHIENYNYNFNFGVNNIVDNISVVLNSQINDVISNPGTGMEGTKYNINNHSLFLSWQAHQTKRIKLLLSSELVYISSRNNNGGNNENQNFFSKEISEFNYGITTNLEYYFNSRLKSEIVIKGRKHYFNKFAFESLFKINLDLVPMVKIGYNFSVTKRYANEAELYGSFRTSRKTGEQEFEEYFTIKGNENLNPEKVYYTGLSVKIIGTNIKIITEPFYCIIENGIYQKTLKTIRAVTPSNIVRDAEYQNFSTIKTYGVKTNLIYHPIDELKFVLNYNYSANSDIVYNPKNSINFSTYFEPIKGTKIICEYMYRDKSIWDEYILMPINDFKYNEGFNGILPSASIVNFSLSQRLNRFLFLKNVGVQISLENAFNADIKYHPVGNYFVRALLFSINANF